MNSGQEEPFWLTLDIVNAVHDRQIQAHGGGLGVRDTALLESAVARPLNRWNYDGADLASLAAGYAFGIARNHPFVDGNKRTAWVSARLFLGLNGSKLQFTTEEAIEIMLALASGQIGEQALAEWFRARAE